MQHGIEPALAVVAFAGPCIGTFGLRVTGKVKNMNHAFPNGLSGKLFAERHRLNKRCRAAMLVGFDGRRA